MESANQQAQRYHLLVKAMDRGFWHNPLSSVSAILPTNPGNSQTQSFEGLISVKDDLGKIRLSMYTDQDNEDEKVRLGLMTDRKRGLDTVKEWENKWLRAERKTWDLYSNLNRGVVAWKDCWTLRCFMYYCLENGTIWEIGYQVV